MFFTIALALGYLPTTTHAQNAPYDSLSADTLFVAPDSLIEAHPSETVFTISNVPRPIKMVYPAPDTVVVVTQVEVNPEGFVQNARILKSFGHLDAEALEAAWQWEFAWDIPLAERQPMWVAIPMRFAVVRVK